MVFYCGTGSVSTGSSDGLRGDEMDGWVVASESFPPWVHLYADDTPTSLGGRIFSKDI